MPIVHHITAVAVLIASNTVVGLEFEHDVMLKLRGSPAVAVSRDASRRLLIPFNSFEYNFIIL